MLEKTTEKGNWDDLETQRAVYGTKSKRLGICTLEKRRLRDLIETFKILGGKERIDYRKFFEILPADLEDIR